MVTIMDRYLIGNFLSVMRHDLYLLTVLLLICTCPGSADGEARMGLREVFSTTTLVKDGVA